MNEYFGTSILGFVFFFFVYSTHSRKRDILMIL